MFTGIIERMGTAVGLVRGGAGNQLRVRCEAWGHALLRGESVAVQGVCLTVAACSAAEFTCDVLGETLARSNLGAVRHGDRLNLERALRADSRLGGHFVSGHVDGTGRVRQVLQRGAERVVRIEYPRLLSGGLVWKGSVACDGVSLTVARLTHEWFEVHLVPVTWQSTSLQALRAGDAVNLEADMLGRYARHASRGETDGVTFERLARAGFTDGDARA